MDKIERRWQRLAKKYLATCHVNVENTGRYKSDVERCYANLKRFAKEHPEYANKMPSHCGSTKIDLSVPEEPLTAKDEEEQTEEISDFKRFVAAMERLEDDGRKILEAKGAKVCQESFLTCRNPGCSGLLENE